MSRFYIKPELDTPGKFTLFISKFEYLEYSGEEASRDDNWCIENLRGQFHFGAESVEAHKAGIVDDIPWIHFKTAEDRTFFLLARGV